MDMQNRQQQCRQKLWKLRTWIVAVLTCLMFAGATAVADDDDDDDDDFEPEFLPGLVAEFRGDDSLVHRRVDEQVSVNWRKYAPDPRVFSDSFHVRWNGLLKIWTPGKYQFSAFSNGRVQIRVLDKMILDRAASNSAGEWLDASEVELDWGDHPIEVRFEKTGDEAKINLFWAGPDFDLEPVASHLLFHEPSQHPDGKFERGRLLTHALRCAACHTIADHQPTIAAPDLDRLAGNIHSDWIVDWLTEEPGRRAVERDEDLSRRMPHFDMTADEAAAIATYLTHKQRAKSTASGNKKLKDKEIKNGRIHFLTLGCVACHRVDQIGESSLFGGGDLSEIAEKRPASFFDEWLKNPAASNPSHRMPVFSLKDGERKSLSAYLASLTSKAKNEKASASNADSVSLEEQLSLGRRLVKRFQCSQCHQLPKTEVEKSLSTSRLLSKAADWSKNCAASQFSAEYQPRYGLSRAQNDAIQEYISQLPVSRKKDSTSIDGLFVVQERNCLGCHGRGSRDGISKHLGVIKEHEFSLERKLALIKPPALDSVGDKLHQQSLHNAITTKRGVRRDWLMVRMPKFRLSDEELAAITEWFIDVDRIPDHPSDEKVEVTSDFSTVGPRLVTTDGFGCTSCHQIGNAKPTNAVPGVHGPQLGMIGEHVRRRWFERWVHNPARISPRMEMPAVKIPIRGVLDGTLPTQLEAVWQILNTNDFNPPKPNPVRVVRRRNDPKQTEQAAVIIDNVESNKNSYVKPIVIGLPNRHSLLFDLEQYRFAGWWLGDVARQRLRGKYWYWETAGAPVVPASKGESEIELIRDGVAFRLVIDPAFPPEFDDLVSIIPSPGKTPEIDSAEFSPTTRLGAGVRFENRLSFGGGTDEQLVVCEQSWAPLEYRLVEGNASENSRSGFLRRLRFKNLPPNSQIRFSVLPGTKTKRGASNAEIVSSDGKWTAKAVSKGAVFDSDNPGQILVNANADGDALELVIVYQTSLPVDQFLAPVPPEVAGLQEEMRIAPGFDAVRLPLPEAITPTAITQRESGELVFSTLKGRLWQASDSNADGVQDQLSLLGDGFSAPFGVKIVETGGGKIAIDLADKTALLRLFDNDNNGEIDQIKTIASGWGHSTDYHGWVVGIPTDKEGNYYLSVTNRNGPASILRGRVMKLTPRQPTADDPRLYSVHPTAVGLRFPLGLARNRNGDLFVSDNQGQYNPYNELNDVTNGGHFGFFNLKGLEDSKELKQMPRLGPAIGIPHPWVRSVNGICFLETPEKLRNELGRDLYGPFEGHLIGCESTTRKMVRVSLQKVNGRNQGAAYPLTTEPPRGAAKLLRPLTCAVVDNGDIYIGSVHDSAWGAGRNVGEIVRMRFNGELPPGIAEMRQTSSGFELLMTKPVDKKLASDVKNYSMVSFRRVPTSSYGGPDIDRRTERLSTVSVSNDGKRIELKLESIRDGFVYELHLKNLTKGQTLFHPAEAYYTVGPLE